MVDVGGSLTAYSEEPKSGSELHGVRFDYADGFEVSQFSVFENTETSFLFDAANSVHQVKIEGKHFQISLMRIGREDINGSNSLFYEFLVESLECCGQKFLYLEKEEFAETWVNGGDVPLRLASSSLSDLRVGTKTPDEGLIHESTWDFRQFGNMFDELKNVSFRGTSINGTQLPDNIGANYHSDDGLILSLSNVHSDDICQRLGKTVCVRIDDVVALKSALDSQLGVESWVGDCKYTSDHQRNHFLKSTEDSWQQEYRLFWPVIEKPERWVKIPAGLASKVHYA